MCLKIVSCARQIYLSSKSPEVSPRLKIGSISNSLQSSSSFFGIEAAVADPPFPKKVGLTFLSAHNLLTTKVAKVASRLTTIEEGERVYNVAAPVGIFYEDVVPLLEGFYMGQTGMKAYYTVPAMGGSSESPIFNYDNGG